MRVGSPPSPGDALQCAFLVYQVPALGDHEVGWCFSFLDVYLFVQLWFHIVSVSSYSFCFHSGASVWAPQPRP